MTLGEKILEFDELENKTLKAFNEMFGLSIYGKDTELVEILDMTISEFRNIMVGDRFLVVNLKPIRVAYERN